MATSDQKLDIDNSNDQADDIECNDKFEKLFYRYFKPLCFFCQYKFELGEDEAKDIVHTAFVRLLESQLSFISDLSARAYLYKITAGICIDLIRRESVKQRYFDFLQQDGSTSIGKGNHVEFKQLQGDLNNAIKELPDQMRRVFELSRNEGLKYSEIALRLGISKKTVETQMSRALTKLRQRLASYL
ncbi:MAG TPA: RNA polymerase sigma-70 factor [Flavisolibacter sp.]|nr:RNA polymerase sigma-70 factor [Flavisolibacter sp.]